MSKDMMACHSRRTHVKQMSDTLCISESIFDWIESLLSDLRGSVIRPVVKSSYQYRTNLVW